MAVQASLVYTAPDGSKQDLVLNIGEDTTIGRHPNCSLTISQPSVSRRHARLWFDQGVWFVEDLQSSNGTFVNNRRINRAQLTEGDELRCGDFSLTYGVEERTRAVPTSGAHTQGSPASASPQVSNRATVGIDSPPPIPEAPRLNPPKPAPSAPSAPAAPATPVFDDRNAAREEAKKTAQLEKELIEARAAQGQLRDELNRYREDLENTRNRESSNQDEIVRLSDALQVAQQEKDAAIRDVQRLEEQRERLETELANLTSQNREFASELDAARSAAEAQQAQVQAAQNEVMADKTDLADQVDRLQQALTSKDDELSALRQDLEDAQLRASNQATADEPKPKTIVGEPNEALAEHSSELRVALKAASGFVQEVKDVFCSVSNMKPGTKATKSVLDVQDAFEETGGMDPVNSLEIAFDRMEQTARTLRRLSKGK